MPRHFNIWSCFQTIALDIIIFFHIASAIDFGAGLSASLNGFLTQSVQLISFRPAPTAFERFAVFAT